MNKLKMHTPNKADDNYIKLKELFPNAVTEVIDENGEVVRAIDKDILMQEINTKVVEGREERYEFNWPDKKKSVLLSNMSINKTLRPVIEDEKTPTGEDSKGEKYLSSGSVDFENTENLYIEGDNLEVLKLLQETYLGKINMIYIDPPYNKGSDFVYEDDFSLNYDEYIENSGQYDEEGNRLVKNIESNGRFHTDWLNMMYPRLKIAKDLLSDDGVIFISIDDNEQSNLKKICDEVFGKGNFVAILSVENNPKGRKNSSFISISSEYCLIYVKNKQKSYFVENVPKKASDMKLDKDGRYVHNSGKRILVGENSFNNPVTVFSSEKNYSVYFRKRDYSLEIRKELFGEFDSDLISKGFIKYYSYNKDHLVENTYTIEKFIELFHAKALTFSDGKIYEKNFNDTIRMKNQLVNREYEAIVRGEKKRFSMELTTTGAGTYLKDLFGLSNSPFPAPKNTGFLKMLITLIENKNMTVLDFFSGSASFADAVMQQNIIDNGKRKFIMVQLPENTDEKSEAYKAGYKNICEIGKERIRRAGKKIKEENKDKKGIENLDVGFRVLKVDSSNMKDVYYRPDDFEMSMLDKMEDNIKEDRTSMDLLFQVMLDLGIMLSSKIDKEVIDGKVLYSVEDDKLIACFDEDLTEEVVEKAAKRQPKYFVTRDSSVENDSLMTNFEQIFNRESKNTVWRVI